MNKITDIATQVNHNDRCSVYINGKFAFGISQLDLLKFSLKIGKELNDSELKEILYAIDETRCQDYVNSLVCSRMYTERELRKKLAAKKFSDDVIDTVILRLSEYGYVDDKAYAEMYVSEVKQKYGVYKIRQKLFEKGVPEKIIDESLQNLCNTETAVTHLKAKLRGKPLLAEDKQKILRFLVQKGFTYDESHEAIRIYMEDLDDSFNE